MSDQRPIGIFDSGLGGLTVARAVQRVLPREQLIYFGDTLRCPYGGRSRSAVREFSREISTYLLSQNVKMLVIACNTISATALDIVRECAGKGIAVLSVIEPASAAGITFSSNKRIGVIGTRGTVASRRYSEILTKLDPAVTVFEKACPLLVPFVEENILTGPLVEPVIESYLDEVIDYGVDTVILGCTHYPLLTRAIHRVAGGRVSVIDSALWTAKEVEKILNRRGIASLKRRSDDIFYVSDLTQNFRDVSIAFMEQTIDVQKVDLETELSKLK
ncbi:MAG: glutamate racemase [Fibrobacterota bacterium]